MWIKGFEDRYEITQDGKVFSYIKGKKLERKLVPDKNGYLTINIKKDGKVFCKKIHREVAMAFIEPFYGEQVNHKDGNKLNNSIDNLEWCTGKENISHMWENKLKKLGNKYISSTTGLYGVHCKGKSYVARVRRGGKEIYLGSYDTPEEAYEVVKHSLNEEINNLKIKEYKLVKKIYQYDKNMNLINTYERISEAESKTGLKNQTIGKAILGKLKQCGGFTWKREEEKIFL